MLILLINLQTNISRQALVATGPDCFINSLPSRSLIIRKLDNKALQVRVIHFKSNLHSYNNRFALIISDKRVSIIIFVSQTNSVSLSKVKNLSLITKKFADDTTDLDKKVEKKLFIIQTLSLADYLKNDKFHTVFYVLHFNSNYSSLCRICYKDGQYKMLGLQYSLKFGNSNDRDIVLKEYKNYIDTMIELSATKYAYQYDEFITIQFFIYKVGYSEAAPKKLPSIEALNVEDKRVLPHGLSGKIINTFDISPLRRFI